MLGLLASLVFVTAGCTSVAVIGSSVRGALPAIRRIVAEHGSIAQDRVFLYTLIETPRHDGTPPPRVEAPAARPEHAFAQPAFAGVARGAIKRRRQAFPAPLRAAA
ncbi:hypothetical protein [Novosphingobium nitrogenifigens]|nr:hypothetical protein [Novosphingobium nitrogenifigens]